SADQLGDRGHGGYGASNSTCNERKPRTKAFGMRSGAVPAAKRRLRNRGSSSSNITRISRRASAAPKQKCVPNPNGRGGVRPPTHVEGIRVIDPGLVAVGRRVHE